MQESNVWSLTQVFEVLMFLSLQKPRCKTCSSEPHIRTSDHLFLDLSKVYLMHIATLLPIEFI